MIGALRKLGGLFDSPTFDRDRTNLISGFTIGSAGLLLNGAVMFFVLPLLLDPDDESFRRITESVGFGQTLALILLGGATILATLLIPLRLASVFWGPRIGRYFDQIVLSGISPVRFVIGKALSQNLFLGLIFFLLLPYLILCLTLGGVEPIFFFACVFLVWLYCMALAMVTLWLSLYVNELISAVLVMLVASIACALGATPIPFQPFWLTPFPALVQPIYASLADGNAFPPARIMPAFRTLFFGCSAGMLTIIGFATLGIYLGPLYGIIRDNSTFGEVVRPGDSRRKRWFRLRHHIQRPSELAFFYENRSGFLRDNDGLFRWIFGYLGLQGIQGIVVGCFVGLVAFATTINGPQMGGGFVEFMHTFNLVVHGIAMALAIVVFSHARNTMYLRTPFILGRRVTVAKADNWCFFLFVSVSTAVAIGLPTFMQTAFLQGESIYPATPNSGWGRYNPINLARIHVEGTLALTCSAVVIYLFQKYLCQLTWLRFTAFVAAVGGYLVFFCGAPMLPLILTTEMIELREYQWLVDWAPTFTLASPFGLFGYHMQEFANDVPQGTSTIGFWVLHGAAILLLPIMIRLRSKGLRSLYLPEPGKGSTSPPKVQPSTDTKTPAAAEAN